MKIFKYSALLAIVAITATSCLKEKYQIDIAENTTRPITEFTYAKDGVGSLALDYGTQFVEVDLTELRIPPRSEIGKDVQVKIALNNSIVADAGFDPPPAGAFTLLATDYTLTPENKKANVRIRINPSLITGGFYAIGLSIMQVSEGEISQTSKDIVVEVKVKNIYEGDYHATGLRQNHSGPNFSDPVTASFDIDHDKYLYTIDQFTVETDVADLIGQAWMYLEVDPTTNNVTVTPSFTSPTFLLSNNGPCTYNPATKTFSLNYKYYNAAGNLREINEVIVAN
ncbi:MAG TPA: DUF4361 domain-containing protein [Chitinophagaceae bacterium]|nr:DUF4361 domain-containing protein [Chitinophagaceae bacterium]